MKHFDSKTDEVVGIEGEKRSNRVDVHGRDQPNIIYFRTADAVLGSDQALPLGYIAGVSGSSVKTRSIFSTSLRVKSIEKPSPLLSKGRVATFQNSEMF